MTGYENLEFYTSLSGARRSRQELMEVLNQAGLDTDSARRRASTYSKGMRQKVGIAIALAKQARALLLDEPLSGLDPAAANSLCTHLGELRDRGCAILMATHDVFRAKEVGTRIGILKEGRMVDDLQASELDAKEIESVYLTHMHGEDGVAA